MKNKPDNSPPKSTINALIVALFLAAIPHFIYQPAWVGMTFCILMSWRLLHHWRGWPLPSASRWLRVLHNVTALLTIVLLVSQFGLTIGRDAGAALLTMMLAFKVVEIRSLRDYYVSCFLGFFLVITNFFYSQSVFMVGLMLAVIIGLTFCLISVNSLSQDTGAKLKLSAKLVAQSLPMMVFLFILFPRISGPIWGLPEDANANQAQSLSDQLTLGELPQTGTSGIGDNIRMGNISQLIQSDEIAFRVKFENDNVPPNSKLYWRGPVLSTTDGTVWSPLNQDKSKAVAKITDTAQLYRYAMTLEPNNKTWLFALDMPTNFPETIQNTFTADGRLLSQNPIKHRSQYSLTSALAYQFNVDSEPNLNAALQLPEDKHPRTRELAKRWQETYTTPETYISHVLAIFREDGFAYTLTPPILRGDTVDQFLFDTREGFCEHYAASFTVLMRAAGIPARVVTGYQGGEINPIDNILTVRQRDAHAWSEVWLSGKGWVRIDPTSAVSIHRIEQGMNDLLPAARLSPRMLGQDNALVDAWKNLKNNWNAFNTAWDMWVVSFGPERQLALLSKLGMNNPNWQKMIIALVILFSLIGVLMLLSVIIKRPERDPGLAIYLQFCQKLSKLGVTKYDYEGPNDFSARAQTALPELVSQIHSISQGYSDWRYRQSEQQLLEQLRQQVKQFPRQH